MEKQINKKIEQHQLNFKKDIKEWFTSRNLIINSSSTTNNEDYTSEFLKYIYDYANFNINENDLKKRKRIKNVVPQYDLCIAKRANGEQCTRRKKNDSENEETSQYCGTHIKGTPHGLIDVDLNKDQKTISKVEVWVKDIKGINYYIDNNNNVYSHEDVISNKTNPAIIAKWVKNDDNVYSIPQFEI